MIMRIKSKGNRHGKKNGSRVSTKTGYSYRVYCRECPIPNMSHPEEAPHGCPAGKVFTCPSGHVTEVRR